ncbi:DUF421 domain-containing protein [Caenispirillum bisanense]|uniref:DUF421 domain-containing protein n=1 Tax=Caenispirillum bisanense TaxID=414052 RepID=UPI0031DB6A7A
MTLQEFLTDLQRYIGDDADTITWWQMSLRAMLLFLWGLVLVRIGGRRAFGRNSAFDIVLAVVIGSSISRAITAGAPFFPTIVAMTVLVGLHAVLTHLSFRWRLVGALVKGRDTRLVRDGALDWEAMRRTGITERDLREAAHRRGLAGVDDIRDAYIERSGDVTVIPKDRDDA